MTGKIELYPLWLRIWHWSNATLFLILLATGVSLHFAGPNAPFIPFGTAVALHNAAGITLSILYAIYVIANLMSGNWRHYWPRFKGLVTRLLVQMKFYGFGIFRGEPHPYPSTVDCKFNPLQQLAYLGVMYGMMPILILTGLAFLYPELAPESVMGMDGLWPLATLHVIAGFLLTAFLVGHLYLATAGETVTHEFKKMVYGEKITQE